MSKLSVLAHRGSTCSVGVLPPSLADIVTPFKLEVWAKELDSHPDIQFRDFILTGIERGFKIGFDARSIVFKSARRNMVSAFDHSEVIDEYLAGEKAMGRVGSVANYPFVASHCHTSPFGVIPKKSKPGKWRLIVDLSSPDGHSVNDGIDKELCGLSYVSVDDVVECILSTGTGALMAKVDIKQAYRNVPVHPDDRCLLGMVWRDEILVDKVLPFGLRSAPLIFSALADAIQWIIQQRGVELLFHYLDDYITIGPPQSDLCQHNLKVVKDTCDQLGVPIEADKTEGPSTCITFLGMELDSINLVIRLPESKLVRLRQLLQEWSGCKAMRKRDLLSLIGYLQHASKAVRQGRSFVRRLITLSTVVRRLDGFVRLNLSARSDIVW